MIPYIRGRVTKQAHVGIPEGTTEEEYARNGFTGRYVHFYRTEPLVNWSRIEGPLKPRAYDLMKLNMHSHSAQDYVSSRKTCFYNADVKVQFASLPSASMNYYFRNADADEAFFVHRGQGRVQTDFGPMSYRKGDYVVIPRGTTYRWQPQEETDFLIIESQGEITLPEKGLMGQHALFDPAVIEVPTPEAPVNQKQAQEFEVRIKRNGEITKVFYPFDPMNVQGWKGTLSAWRLNIQDIRPVLSDRYHMPPTAHATFMGNGFVVCTFLPRPLENGDPEALKVPFYHMNIDYDELIFYHDGEFFSREGIQPGMVTMHPQGIHHGPQKGAIHRSHEKKYTQEAAVMIDTRSTMHVAHELGDVENQNYWRSWQK